MNPILIINYFTSAVLFVIGLLLASGIISSTIEPSTRIIFGIIFIAYSVYRFVTTQSRRRMEKQNEMRDKMKEEREKLIKNVNK